MAINLNKAMILGVIGKDPETKVIASGKKVTTFSVATSHSYKKGEEWVNNTTWHRIVAWEVSQRTLELLTKGSKVHVMGRIENRSYKDSTGQDRIISEIISEEIIPLGKTIPTNKPQAPTQQTQSPASRVPPDDDIPF